MRLVQALTPAQKVKRREFCEEMQLKLEEDGFVERLIFSDEATFYISGKVNRHNICVWRTKQPHAQIQHQREPTISVRCPARKGTVHFSSLKQL
jgi:hypothetical protein